MMLSTTSFWDSPSSPAWTLFDIHPHGWIVHVLWNIYLAHTRQAPDPLRQVLSRVVGEIEVFRIDLYVDGGGHPPS